MFKYKIIGFVIVILGISFNELTIKIISSNETKFVPIEKSILLLLLQIAVVSVGLYIFLKKKTAIHNLTLLFGSVLFFLIFLELVLSISVFHELTSDTPLWIPSKYKQYNSELLKSHLISSSKNSDGFNDINHGFKKTQLLRIAILGDSFIWGYGAPDSVIWTRKLERLFKKDNLDCKIMNWGKSGWSTSDQFNFLINKGIKYDFDYLVFTFVVNDPDPGKIPHKLFLNTDGFVFRNIIRPISFFFPNSVSFIMDLIQNFLSTYYNYGYYNWLNNEIYTKDNLLDYSQLLYQIKNYCERANIEYSFILTPENHSLQLENYFQTISEIMRRNKVRYLNLFPYVKSELKNYSVRELWANPADGHPGELVTKVIADHSYSYLLSEILKNEKSITNNPQF